MKILTYLIILFVCGTDIIHASTASERFVSGNVIAADTRIPLSGCTVGVWLDDDVIATGDTDESGNYSISVMASENFIVQAWPPPLTDIIKDEYYINKGQYDQEDETDEEDDEYDEEDDETNEDDQYNYSSTRYLTQYYYKQTRWESADLVSTQDQNATGIDFELETIPDIGICGTVYNDSFDSKDIKIVAFSDMNQFFKVSTTDANGKYTINFLEPADNYRVAAIIDEDEEINYYYSLPENQQPGVDVPTYSTNIYELATFIKPISPYLQHIDIIISKQSCIGGKVCLMSNEPVQDAWVNAWSKKLNAGNGSSTDENGRYTICGMPPVLPEDASTDGYFVMVEHELYPESFFQGSGEDF